MTDKMHVLQDKLLGLLDPLVQRSTSLDRWRGARDFSSGMGGVDLLYWGMVTIIALGAVALVCWLIYKLMEIRERWAGFDRDGSRAGLDGEQIKLLRHIARLLSLKEPASIYISQEAFDRGVAKLMRGKRVAAMPVRTRSNLGGALESIRKALAFTFSDRDLSETISSTRQLKVGSTVFVDEPDQTESVSGKLVETEAETFVVQIERRLDIRAGDRTRITFPIGAVAWEFGAVVSAVQGVRLTIGHTENTRVVNRRRFPRVPTVKHAYVAEFPFTVRDPGYETPQFVGATLEELAGPGMVLVQSDVRADLGEKLLVTVRFSEDLVIQGVSRVRRAVTDDAGETHIAVELVGLDSGDLAELVRQTNIAANPRSVRSDVQPVPV